MKEAADRAPPPATLGASSSNAASSTHSSRSSAMSPLCTLVALAAFLAALHTAECNQFAPHLRNGSPWFEGWYTRITAANASIGFIFGDYPNQQLTDPSQLRVSLAHASDQLHLHQWTRTISNNLLCLFLSCIHLQLRGRPHSDRKRRCPPDTAILPAHGGRLTAERATRCQKSRRYE